MGVMGSNHITYGHAVSAALFLIILAGSASALISLSPKEPDLTFQQMEVNDKECWPFIIGIDRDNQISSHNPLQTTYSKNLNCVRIITAPLGHRVRVEFDDEYDIEEVEDKGEAARCDNDYLLFQDGPFAFSPKITTICGLSRSGPIRSSSGYMRVVFRTDPTFEKTGFNMTIYYDLIEACYFSVPLHQQTSFQVSMTEAALSTGPNKTTVDCVWDIHTNRPNEWMWISINSIFNQIQLLNTSARQIEMYPADEFFRINEKNSVKTTYLLDENRVVEACRVLIHVCSSKLQFVPTFTVNATAYRPPNLQTGECTADRFLCGPNSLDDMCIPNDLLCNGYKNCKGASDEEEGMCKRLAQGRKKNGGPVMSMEMILVLVGVGITIIIVAVFTLVYTVRRIKRKQLRARNADSTAIWSANGPARKSTAGDSVTDPDVTSPTYGNVE